MKTLITRTMTFTLLLTFTFSFAQTISKEERKRALNLYDRAMSQTSEYIKGLSPEQLNFKPAEDSWSIADCVEHMALSETMFMDMLNKSLETPADPSKASMKSFDDKTLYNMITDRSQKVKTSAPLEPSNKWSSTKETFKAFKQARKDTEKFIRNTDSDLRNHYAELPIGPIDTYQMLLFGAGHQMRHNNQISEIMNHPDFPGS